MTISHNWATGVTSATVTMDEVEQLTDYNIGLIKAAGCKVREAAEAARNSIGERFKLDGKGLTKIGWHQ